MTEVSLGDALGRRLAERLGVVGHVRAFVRDAHPYASSHVLERWTVEFDSPRAIELVAKRLDDDGVLPGLDRARRGVLYDAARELAAYEYFGAVDGLPLVQGLGTLHEGPASWFVMRAADGVPLSEVGELATWARVASSAAVLHDYRNGSPDSVVARWPALAPRSLDWYRAWFAEARAALGASTSEEACALLDEAIDVVPSLLMTAPQSIIHGEFYAPNIWVSDAAVRAVDLETCGFGAGVLDLAALVTGWPADAQEILLDSYRNASQLWSHRTKDELRSLVAVARTQLAAQWIAWFGGHIDPYRVDWNRELLDAYAAVTQ